MMTDTEIKVHGYEALRLGLGIVEAEKFITIIRRDNFDYTKWREHLFEGLSSEEINRKAMEYLSKKNS